MRNGNAKRYFIADNIGSTTGLLDAPAGGSIARTYTYTPDGQATSTGTGPSTELQFGGGYTTHGLIHYGARYYDPGTARWTQPNALTRPANLSELNHYSYVGGNPTAWTDPPARASLTSC